MAKIDAYAYYLSTYAQLKPTRYDTHKKSDLRKVYTSMVKTNKDSPLYKFPNQSIITKYAIDIKENAKSIQNVVTSLSDSYGDFSDSFRKKVAISSDENTVGVKYVGNGFEEAPFENFNIEVKKLSSPQVNTGNYLKNDALSILPDSYSFDLTMNNASYEFQFSVNPGDTNLDVLQKLAGLVNRSSLGIHATIRNGTPEVGGLDTSALVLTSRQTGRAGENELIFDITPSPNAESMDTLEYLGIRNVSQHSENALFLFNQEEFQSLSNNFTINDTFELSLNKISNEGEAAEISFKTDIDAVADNISTLTDAFNKILEIAENTDSEATGDTNKLLTEMSAISKSRRESLGAIGLTVAENGSVSVDKEALANAITPENAEQTFVTLARFKSAIGAKADTVAINPMNYVNKVVVNYKNPGRTFPAPYFSSVYSGMMLDRYV